MEKTIRLIIVLIFWGSINAYAQLDEMTEYERGRYELANTALTKITEVCGFQDQLILAVNIKEALKECDDVYEEVLLIENFVIKTCKLANTFKTEAAYLSLSPDLSSVYGGDLLNSWKETGMWYASEREKLENIKTEQDALRELEREKDRIARKSGYGPIIEEIVKAFVQWAQKGTYEKSAQHEERMRTKAVHAFDSLCFIKAHDAWKTNVINVRWGGDYNADSETRVIELYYREWDNKKWKETASVKGVLPLTPKEHEDFYKKTDRFEYMNRLCWGSYALDLCLVNGKVFPSSACIRGKNVNFAESGHFTVKADSVMRKYPDLSKYLSGHTFVYSDYINNIIFSHDAIKIMKKTYNVLNAIDKNIDHTKLFCTSIKEYIDLNSDDYVQGYPCFSELQFEILIKEAIDDMLRDGRKQMTLWYYSPFLISYTDFMNWLSPYLKLENQDEIKDILRREIIDFASHVAETDLYDYSFISNSPLYWLLCANEDMSTIFAENCVLINLKKMRKQLKKHGWSYSQYSSYFFYIWLLYLKG